MSVWKDGQAMNFFEKAVLAGDLQDDLPSLRVLTVLESFLQQLLW